MATIKPRILFLLPVLLVGGAERHTLALTQSLRARGYAVDIMVHGQARSPTIAEAFGEGVIFLEVRGMSSLSGWLRTWWRLRGHSFDVLVAVNQTPLIVAVVERLLWATRAKIACVFHTSEMQSYERHHADLLRHVSPFVDLMVYVGANQRQLWEARGVRPRRTALIPNGIEADHFAAARGERERVRMRLGLVSDDYLLGIVASFRVEKNHVELVAALAEARRGGVDALVLCIGDGETRPAVVEMAERLGVADRMIFAGEQADVAPFIAACDVGVLCSTAETFPLCVLEFLASGTPMISAAVGGAAEIVRDGENGILYESGDVSAFTAAIAALSDPERRADLGSRAQTSVAQYSVECMTTAYAEAFDALVTP